MTLLGIDIGTTHVKARAYDEAGRLLADPEFTYTFCDEATAESRTFQLLAAQ